MPTPEARPNEPTAERAREALPQFSIPGFETLPPDRQAVFLAIPADRIDQARPLIEAEIGGERRLAAEEREDRRVMGVAEHRRATASARESQAAAAIDAFHRAEDGDEEAKEDLEDHKKELLGEDEDDEEIFSTIIESESSDPFAQDTAMEVMLSDPEAKAAQKVLDLFQEFRGDLPSADDALAPDKQLKLFLLLTKGQGTVADRHAFARRTLEMITEDGTKNLFEGLNAQEVVKDGELNEPAIEDLNKQAIQVLHAEAAGDSPPQAA